MGIIDCFGPSDCSLILIEKESFYRQLDAVLRDTKRKCENDIVLEDFNCPLCQDGMVYKLSGDYCKWSESVTLLVKKLYCVNFFSEKYAWCHPRTGQGDILDFFIVSRKSGFTFSKDLVADTTITIEMKTLYNSIYKSEARLGRRVNADVDAYVETLQTVVVRPPWIDSMPNRGRLDVFQQDSVPSHEVLKIQDSMDGGEFSSSCHAKLRSGGHHQ
ncbi:hypothetical protein ACTXT7_003218 [Hymenolepis weldensis]